MSTDPLRAQSFRRAEGRALFWDEQGAACQDKFAATCGLEIARG